MALLKFVFYALVALIFIVIGLVFLSRNQSPIDLDLIFLEVASLSSGTWVLLSLLAGVFLGYFLTLPKRMAQAVKIRSLSKKLAENSGSAPPATLKIESKKGQ